MALAEKPYLPRVIDRRLLDLIEGLPAIAIEGAKSIGKTTSASRLAKSIIRLDDPATMDVVKADPARALDRGRPLLVDEWQRHPPIWDAVRRAVDEDGAPGQFILTGSAVPADAPAHSGAGRILSVRMRPLSFFERQLHPTTVSLAHLLRGTALNVMGESSITLEQYTDEILASGFPNIRERPQRFRADELRSYVSLLVTKGVKESGHYERTPATMAEWLRAYAAATATTASWETIRDAATPGHAGGISRPAAERYREALRASWMLDPLSAWIPGSSHLRRAGRAPKHHLADPALAASLVGIGKTGLLDGDGPAGIVRDGAFLGALFESLVALSIRVYAEVLDAAVYHYRDAQGRREIDFIVEREDRAFVAIESKLGSTVGTDDVKHLVAMKELAGPRMLAGLVVNTGTTAYRRDDGILVVPLALLSP